MKLVTDLGLTSRPLRTGAAFSPVDLFRNAENGLFVDAAAGGSLFSTHDGNVPPTVGNAVGRIEDLSGNLAHATQPILTARPILARVPRNGLRNVTLQSENFANIAWNKVSGAVIVPLAEGFRFADDTAGTNGFPQMVQSPSLAAGPWCFWVEAKADQTPYLVLTDQEGAVRASVFDLSNGSVGNQAAGHSASITALGAGRYRCAISFSRSGGAGNVRVQLSSTGTSNGGTTRTGLHSVILYRAQLESGSAATGYQRVGSRYDVTETGQPDLWHLFNDGIDDEVVATLPDLGTSATVAYASDAGVTISTGQIIGAGSFGILRDQRLFALMVINRALGPAETARLSRFLQFRSGGYSV